MRLVNIFSLLGVLILGGCNSDETSLKLVKNQPAYLHEMVHQLSEVIVHDIFSPPVASRIYAYASIAGYEANAMGDPSYRSLAGQLNGLKEIPAPQEGAKINFALASIKAFLDVGTQLIFSEHQMEEYELDLMNRIKAEGISKRVFQNSISYGEQVAQHILQWASKDMYSQTRTYPKFAVNQDPARWQPTPPDYMDGIEPHWNEIRPMVIKSAQQFAPPPPTPFDMNPNSPFYKEVMEVYQALDGADKEERIAISKFWDCNPYVSQHIGHVMYAIKKITPGGHWMGIVGVACQTADSDFSSSLEAYAMTSIALFDAFISCWDEKYRSNLIRPETVINKYIDENWVPGLQTPPFPEYTSGHSVISRASAIVLTHLFGEEFPYEDTVELEYGLPSRKYKSFIEASEEAAMSRLYGGIHYMPAIQYGVEQGEQVGKWIVANIQTKN